MMGKGPETNENCLGAFSDAPSVCYVYLTVFSIDMCNEKCYIVCNEKCKNQNTEEEEIT